MHFLVVVDLILALTFVAAGMNLTLALYNFHARRYQPYWWAFSLLRVGGAIAMTLIAEAVHKSTQAAAAIVGHTTDIPVTWRVVTYCLALLAVCVGSVGVLFDQRRRYSALTKHERSGTEPIDRRRP